MDKCTLIRKAIPIWICVFSSIASAGGLRFQSERYGYQLSVPSGWTQIPDDVLKESVDSMPAEARRLVRETGFQYKYSKEWFIYPFVIIQVVPQERTRINRMVTEKEFLDFVKQLPGLSGNRQLKNTLEAIGDQPEREWALNSLAALSKSTVKYDLPKRKYWLTVTSNEPSVGKVTTLIGGTFLANGVAVQVNAYSRTDQMDKFALTILELHESVSNARP